MIKGIELSRAYFYDVCFPVLKKEFSSYLPRMAAGLIGEGSECYGYDDAISRDHDFGPGFQIFIPIKKMAGQIVTVLKRQQLTSLSEPFLLAQGPEVIKRISDPALRNSNPWVE